MRKFNYEEMLDTCIENANGYILSVESLETKAKLSIELAKVLASIVNANTTNVCIEEENNNIQEEKETATKSKKAKATSSDNKDKTKNIKSEIEKVAEKNIINVTNKDGDKIKVVVDGFCIDDNGIAIKLVSDENMSSDQVVNYNKYITSVEGIEAKSKYNQAEANKILNEDSKTETKTETKKEVVKKEATKKTETKKETPKKEEQKVAPTTESVVEPIKESVVEEEQPQAIIPAQDLNQFISRYEYGVDANSTNSINYYLANYTCNAYSDLNATDIPKDVINAFIDSYNSRVENAFETFNSLIAINGEDHINYYISAYFFRDSFNPSDPSHKLTVENINEKYVLECISFVEFGVATNYLNSIRGTDPNYINSTFKVDVNILDKYAQEYTSDPNQTFDSIYESNVKMDNAVGLYYFIQKKMNS